MGRPKTPEHLVHCRKSAARFRDWPPKTRPAFPPDTPSRGFDYLRQLLATPADFAAFLKVTEFYSKICTR